MKPNTTHESYLRYHSFRYLKVGLLLVVASIAAYVVANPPALRRGDTVVGYSLGVLSGLLMLWLLWFGVRKRRYASAGAPLRGWLSAHVYLGATLLILVPLHAAFIFGANLHTFAYVLLVLVILTGVVGVILYATVPEQMTQNRPGETMADLRQRLADIDRRCSNLADVMPDEIVAAVLTSINETRIGGGIFRQLRGGDRNCGTTRAKATVAAVGQSVPAKDQPALKLLLAELRTKELLVARIRKDVRLKAWLDAWLVLHVPLAFAATAAVAAHVFVVLYW